MSTPTITVSQLKDALAAYDGLVPADKPVRLIVNGVAYPVSQVWFEPLQDGAGALCIGDDPR